MTFQDLDTQFVVLREEFPKSRSRLVASYRLISPTGRERVQSLQCNLKPQKTGLREDDRNKVFQSKAGDAIIGQ